MQQLPLGVRLHDRATFASFITGSSAGALAQIGSLGGSVRMLWLGGPAGSGKSHLLQAWCAAAPGRAYLPLKPLRALGPAVLEGADGLAGVAIDDAGSIAGDASWEGALFRLYNDCDAARVPVLFADALPAQAHAWSLPDLRSRLAAVPGTQLAPLDENGQRAALQLHATQRGLVLSDEVAQYLQRRYPRDMHSLCALLDQLDAAALREQRRLTLPFIRQITGAS